MAIVQQFVGRCQCDAHFVSVSSFGFGKSLRKYLECLLGMIEVNLLVSHDDVFFVAFGQQGDDGVIERHHLFLLIHRNADVRHVFADFLVVVLTYTVVVQLLFQRQL